MTTFNTSFPRSLLALCSVATALGLPAASHATEPAASSASLYPAITALIGDAACEDPGQCHVVPVGAKACGGPSGYLAWSSRNTDQRSLLTAVEAHRAAQQEENKTSGMASDCRMMPAPSATCRPRASDGKKTCQLGQGGLRGAD